MRRTDLMDTSPEMHHLQLELLRKKGVEWRIKKTLELIQASIDIFPEQTKRAVRAECKRKWRNFPTSS